MSTTKTKKAPSKKHENLSPVYHLLGEQDRGVTNCPHCGARGRYVRTFICEDGTTKEAMRGCYQKWPKSDMPSSVGVSRNRADIANQKGRRVASWDINILAADEAFRAGEITFAELRNISNHESARRNEWVRNRDAQLLAERNGTASPAQALTTVPAPAPSAPRSAPPAALESREYHPDIFAPSTRPERPAPARPNSAANSKTFSYLDRIRR